MAEEPEEPTERLVACEACGEDFEESLLLGGLCEDCRQELVDNEEEEEEEEEEKENPA